MSEIDRPRNRDFSAMSPQGIDMEVEFYEEGEETPTDETEEGFVLNYSEEELTYLGDGDPLRGVQRIWELVNDGSRTLWDIAADPRRPLQDELDLLMPPSPGSRPN